MPSADRPLRLAHAVALGVLHGPTELLPVSSSAHTELIPWLAGWPYARLDGERRKSFEVALHAGAGAALALHWRRELLAEARSLTWLGAGVLALSLAPPAVAGLLLGDQIERRLGGPRSIASGLAVGAAAMLVADSRGDDGRDCADARAGDGLALGLAQASALMPGVSRSGATLAAARARGFGRAGAWALSWRTALPVIAAASALKGARLLRTGAAGEERAALVTGAVSAFASTLLSAAIVARRQRRGFALLPYALYRCLLAALVIDRVRRAP